VELIEKAEKLLFRILNLPESELVRLFHITLKIKELMNTPY